MQPSRLLVLLILATYLALPTRSLAKTCGNLKDTAVELAGSMETFRLIPESTPFAGEDLDPAAFLYLAAKCIDRFGDGYLDLLLPQASTAPRAPGNLYPKIALDDDFYRAPFDKDAYVAFFRRIDSEFGVATQYPQAFEVDGSTARVRYVEAVYYAAGILRSVKFFNQLPGQWNKHIIAPKGLVPWQTPSGYEEYTSALTSESGYPFYRDEARRYYGRSPHEYRLFRLAMDIIGGEKQAYDAGKLLYDWVIAQWIRVAGYSVWTPQHGFDQSGWERSHYFLHTSGVPRRIMDALLRSVGIPASSAGAAYFAQQGWVNVDSHQPYGSDPLQNPYYYESIPPPLRNMPFPGYWDDFIQGIRRIAASPRIPAPLDEERSLSISPRDVLDYGPDYVLDHSGDFEILSVRVKTPKGYFYYPAPGFEDRLVEDALTPLIDAAHARGKKVYAVFSTLADSLTAKSTPAWKQMLNETYLGNESYPNILISPCVEPYKEKLKGALRALAQNFEIDGIVLDHHYYFIGNGTDDRTGNVACPTGDDWMSDVVTQHAADLITEIRAVDPSIRIVVFGYPLGFMNRYYGLAPEYLGYQDLAALSVLADRIALDFEGTYWAPLQFPTFRSAIADFWSLTGQAPWVSFNLVDEWEYTAEFYTGLLQTTRSEGISGFDLHTALSTSGDLAPAFTESSWEKLAQVIPEPQGWMTVSAGIAALGLLHRARKSVPRA